MVQDTSEKSGQHDSVDFLICAQEEHKVGEREDVFQPEYLLHEVAVYHET